MARNGLKVGTDIDNTQTVRTTVVRENMHFLASQWKKHKYPRAMDETFTVDMVRVRVRVEEEPEEAAKIDKAAEQRSYE